MRFIRLLLSYLIKVMWQISINGATLDVDSAFSPSFQRTNNVFNFGSLNLTRTLSFELPNTARNNDAFAFASDFHNVGVGARVYHNAVVSGDSVSFSGSLYVEKCEGGKYSAAFSCGDFEALRALSEAGEISFNNCGVDQKLQPLHSSGQSAALNVGTAANSAISNGYSFVVRRYDNLSQVQPTQYYSPSVRLLDLLQNVQSRYGVSVTPPVGYEGLSIVLDKLNAPTSYDVTLKKTALNSATVSANLFIGIDAAATTITWHALTQQRSVAFKFFSASNDIQLTFPVDFPADVFCCDGEQSPTFFGGYGFDTSLNGDTSRRYGRPLSGRTIDIAAGQKFGFFRSTNYVNTRVSASNYTQGFLEGADATPYEYNLQYSEKGDLQPSQPHNYYLRDNYPKIKFIDLLRLYALVSGRYMKISGDAVTYEPYDVDAWAIVAPERVKKITTIKRVFSDFGQNGFISFDSADDIVEPQRVDYHVNNETLTAEKQIAKISFSEGDASKANDDNVYIYDYYTNDEGKVVSEAKKATITLIGDSARLNRVYLPKVAALQQLCDTSTQVEAEIIQSANDFFSMREEQRIYIDGALFVWLSASWSNGVTKIVLQKL